MTWIDYEEHLTVASELDSQMIRFNWINHKIIFFTRENTSNLKTKTCLHSEEMLLDTEDIGINNEIFQ